MAVCSIAFWAGRGLVDVDYEGDYMKKGRTVLEAKRFGIFSCQVDTPLAEVCRLMVTEGISSLVVVDQDGYLQGLLSTTDLLRANLAYDDWMLRPAGAVMSTDVVCVSPSSLLREVAELLLTNRIHRVVVVQMEEGKPRPVAVVSSSDLAYHMVKEL